MKRSGLSDIFLKSFISVVKLFIIILALASAIVALFIIAITESNIIFGIIAILCCIAELSIICSL